jgi:hypothetical protein
MEFGSYRHRTVALKRAFRALFDRQVSTSAQVEFGGEFPLSEIMELMLKNMEHADEELLQLIRRADRSGYEDWDRELMTDAELALFNHINAQHDRLSRRLS